MNKHVKLIIVLIRIASGWFFLYAAINEILYSEALFPEVQGFSTFPISWAFAVLGGSLILGAGVRFIASAGAVLMLIYAYQQFVFPQVSEYLLFALLLVLLSVTKSGRFFGLDKRWRGY